MAMTPNTVINGEAWEIICDALGIGTASSGQQVAAAILQLREEAALGRLRAGVAPGKAVMQIEGEIYQEATPISLLSVLVDSEANSRLIGAVFVWFLITVLLSSVGGVLYKLLWAGWVLQGGT